VFMAQFSIAIRRVVNFYQISDTASERFPASAC
jgi:hypothetical protein